MKVKKRRLPRLPYSAFAHHYEDRRNRTLTVENLGMGATSVHPMHFQWVSFGLFAWILPFYSIELATFIWAAVLFLLPLPALVDWVTQSWELRESTTSIRVLTGSAGGLGHALEFEAIVELDLTRALLGVGVYCAYMLALLVFLKIRPISSGVFG